MVRVLPSECHLVSVVGSNPTLGSQFFFEKLLLQANCQCFVLLCLSVGFFQHFGFVHALTQRIAPMEIGNYVIAIVC